MFTSLKALKKYLHRSYFANKTHFHLEFDAFRRGNTLRIVYVDFAGLRYADLCYHKWLAYNYLPRDLVNEFVELIKNESYPGNKYGFDCQCGMRCSNRKAELMYYTQPVPQHDPRFVNLNLKIPIWGIKCNHCNKKHWWRFSYYEPPC